MGRRGRPHPGGRWRKAVLAAKGDLDSVGGAIRCTVDGLPAGLGAPDFGCNVEGIFSQQLFAVPAVKAVAFGAGFGFAAMRGSQANDPFCMDGTYRPHPHQPHRRRQRRHHQRHAGGL